ncbi:FAD-binding oxidoreductase [Gryllotalpicola reticulitermitis]|uniref:FAD-binding oxidoreductase n=1 Tax=Gryllotalpicola reticulitermitis TaxID=1184153 RepID=A0ABV8Q8G9_9MICO
MNMPTDATALAALMGSVPVVLPGAARYDEATAPDNRAVRQSPAAVVLPRSEADVAQAVTVARRLETSVVVQASGHGAARPLGAAELLIDMSGLAAVRIDAADAVARVGAGAVRGEVQGAAEAHGLLGLAGTSPSVGVAGYTFGGGVGWFTRPYGLAAGKLRTVRYVDGTGRIRRASDDAPDELDRAAIHAFRGGAPVGIATELEFELIRPGELIAGHLLWPIDRAEAVIAAWAAVLPALSEAITSTIAHLQLPPEGPFPPELLGAPVVHLSFVSDGDRAGAGALRAAVCAAGEPVVDSTGPADAARLAQIHLDPPGPVAAVGGGRWLTAGAADRAVELLGAARVGSPDGALMAELRHVASSAPARPGVLTTAPGPFLLHVVGSGDPERRAATAAAVGAALAAAADLDAGVDAISFREADPDVAPYAPSASLAPSALPLPSLALGDLARRLDPDGLFRFERVAPVGTD